MKININLNKKSSSPTQYYWYRSTLMSSPSVNEPIEFNYVMALSLIIAWSLVYLCMVQGLTSSGKIVYVTALFPYVVLVIFFLRGITLKGLLILLYLLFILISDQYIIKAFNHIKQVQVSALLNSLHHDGRSSRILLYGWKLAPKFFSLLV